jgi:hypothetical protein
MPPRVIHKVVGVVHLIFAHARLRHNLGRRGIADACIALWDPLQVCAEKLTKDASNRGTLVE